MALRGTFHSFPPSEILQFLTQSGKTGVLRVSDEQDTKFLGFKSGQLTYAFHQRQIPPLDELVCYRNPGQAPEVRTRRTAQAAWDDVLSRALARRRLHDEMRTQITQSSDVRLSSVVVAQGRLSEEELRAALNPDGIPNELLEKILRGTGTEIPAKDFEDARRAAADPGSLGEVLVHRNLMTRQDLIGAIMLAPDEYLAELLTLRNVFTHAEARQCLEQLKVLRGRSGPTFGLGEYLLVTGKITRQQLERALQRQLVSNQLFGEVITEQGIISKEDVNAALAEIGAMKSDFGLLFPLREQLRVRHGVDPEIFAAAVSQQEDTGQSLVEILGELEGLSTETVDATVREVLVDEVSDVLLWSNASFEFLEELSLDEALAPTTIPKIAAHPQPVSALLLEAHSQIDQLRNEGHFDFSWFTVFVGTDSENQAVYRNITHRLDGRAPLREVRRVMPGNLFSQRRLFAQLLQAEVIRELDRTEAFEQGELSLCEGKVPEALALFRHAANCEGDDPSDTDIREAIVRARRTNAQGLTGRVLRSTSRFLKNSGEQFLQSKAAKAPGISHVIEGVRATNLVVRDAFSTWGPKIGAKWSQLRVATEECAIRMGVGRPLWEVKSFFAGILHQIRRLPQPIRVSLIYVIAFAFILSFFIERHKEDLAIASSQGYVNPNAPLEYIHASHLFQADAPVQHLPSISEDAFFLASRDGMLRAIQGSSHDEPRLLWELPVGEFGDLITAPVVASARVFVGNVRGTLFAVAFSGEVLWERKFDRLENIAPRPLFDDNGTLVALAVVSCEEVHVLDAETGASRFSFASGNRIVARPDGDDRYVFVGSGDNHIYCYDWQAEELVWEVEETDDVLEILRTEKRLIYATRDGRFGALEASTGLSVWSRNQERNTIQAVGHCGDDAVYIELEAGHIEVLSASLGELRSSFVPSPSLNVTRSAPFGAGFLFVCEAGHVGGIDELGRFRWRSQDPLGRISGWAQGDGFIAVTSADGRLVLFPLEENHDTISYNQ